MRNAITPAFLIFLAVAALPFQGYAAAPTYPIFTPVQTTRDRTVSPAHRQHTPPLTIDQVPQYETRWLQFMDVWGPASRLRPVFTGRTPGCTVNSKRF